MKDFNKHPLLRSQIVSHLADAILHGDLRPGEKIVEGKLARQLGVSQGTLREALLDLKYQGLVTKTDRRGTTVAKITTAELEDIYLIRLALEPLAAALAHSRMTQSDFQHLGAILDRMRKGFEQQDYIAAVKNDVAFHQYIWKKSGSKSIQKALNTVWPPIFAYYKMQIFQGILTEEHAVRSPKLHEDLLNALRGRTPDKVYEAFRAALKASCALDLASSRLTESTGEKRHHHKS